VGEVLLTARPRPSLQVALAEGVVEQLPLVQPRGVGRGQPGPPPAMATGEVVRRLGGDVAGTAIGDQEDPPKPAMLPPEALPFRDLVQPGVIGPVV